MVLHGLLEAAAREGLLRALHPFYFRGGAPVILGVVFLAITRDFLFNNRIHDYNTPEMLQFKRPEPCAPYCEACTPEELRFRTFDGHCNNLNQTGMGMSYKRFGRSALKDPGRPDPGLFEPDPYLVAEKLLKAADGKKRATAPIYNLFMTSWINLNLHDWVFHEDSESNPYTLRFGPNKADTFQLNRTFLDEDGYTINTETPWWDASQIYGKTEAQAKALRVPGKCELALDKDGNLPLDTDGQPKVGFNTNWWTGVELLHHLFVLEHNLVCGQLRQQHPDMSEEELYQTGRLIVAAELARIHTVEWTPALLNNDVLNISMHQNWVGLNQAFLIHELKQLADEAPNLKEQLGIKVHQDLLRIVTRFVAGTMGVGHKTELYGTPYSLSEDFVSAYRLHPLIPDEFDIAGDKVSATDMLFSRARNVVKKYGMTQLVNSWGHQPPTILTLGNFPDFLTKVEIPGKPVLRNLAVIDVFRDRERGLPRYNQARREYGIPPAKKFSDITDNKVWQKALKEVYKSVEDIDFLVGCLAESPRPAGYVISNVQFYIFIINASRRILCDRFFQESFDAFHYTQWGLDHVQGTTFKKLLLRHYPQLAPSIGDVTNAFMTWTGSPAAVKDEL